MRRLPIYILLDVSGSMRGEAIKAVNKGVQILISSLRQNPYALETAYISIITFGEKAEQIIPLTELINFQIPELKAEGIGTSLGKALNILTNKLSTEVKQTTPDTKGDWKSIIFIMTDGEPTDDFEIHIKKFKKAKKGVVVACAVGDDSNTVILNEITENVVEIAKLDEKAASSYFQWISDSVGISSEKIDNGKEVTGLEELAPLPKDINKVIDLRKGKSNTNDPFNSFDRQRALNKDKFGNLAGNEFDLAKDNAFTGYQIAILHLYTGEGFNFHLPETALKEKGFSIVRWANIPPSIEEFKRVLNESCQLWIISDVTCKLSSDYIKVIEEFFNSGKGLYLWGDNVPYFADSNAISNKLFGIQMSGDDFADKVLTKKANNKSGFIEHKITFGLDFLYEGITVATFQNLKNLTPLIYSSNGNVINVLYDLNGKRAILDGGFTRLFVKWDTAGTARYVKNAAAWLVNFESKMNK